ncbi:hypothetical protein P7C70_g6239, partial [Phenoliferia sp. Uapishka_3]
HYPGPTTIKSYLDTTSLPLLPHIIFNHRVTSLRHTLPTDGGAQLRWIMEATPTLSDGEAFVEQFDFVVVGNGHYTLPYVPLIEGLKSWEGGISHSRWYRTPEPYRDETVLVIGNSASGYDITRQIAISLFERKSSSPELANALPKIYQVQKGPYALGVPFDAPDAPEWARSIGIFPPVQRIEGKTIFFEDGRTLDDVDHIIFATGYLYSFPFADHTQAPFSSHPLTVSPFPSCSPASPSGGLRVHNLDRRQLFYLPDPTLSFICLPLGVIPFPLGEAQSRLVAAFYADRLPKPLVFEVGVDEEGVESHSAHFWGGEREYDEQDGLLKDAGDGGEGGKWGRAERATRDLRVGCVGLRKSLLSY